jgi:hypothetical protein
LARPCGRCSHGNCVVTFGRTPGPGPRRRPGTGLPTYGRMAEPVPAIAFVRTSQGCPDLWSRLGSRGQRVGGQRAGFPCFVGLGAVVRLCHLAAGTGSDLRCRSAAGGRLLARDCGRLAQPLSWFERVFSRWTQVGVRRPGLVVLRLARVVPPLSQVVAVAGTTESAGGRVTARRRQCCRLASSLGSVVPGLASARTVRRAFRGSFGRRDHCAVSARLVGGTGC